MRPHPSEADLALLAGGECGTFSRMRLERHVQQCTSCREGVTRFSNTRSELASVGEPNLDWDAIAAEMRANIRLGLAAGECIRDVHVNQRWNPRLAIAVASLVVLIGSNFLLNRSNPQPASTYAAVVPVLESNQSGIELRRGSNSLTLLNRRGAVVDQTVSAQGEIRARYVDGETGSVTINNVYLE